MSDVTATEFGEIVLGMLNQASFPGEISEKVTDMKACAIELRDGVIAFHDTGDKHSKNDYQMAWQIYDDHPGIYNTDETRYVLTEKEYNREKKLKRILNE